MSKFAIGIPTLNRYDLLKPTLDKYAKDFADIDIFIIDNGNQGIELTDNTHLYVPEKNLGVAASWNALCSEIFLSSSNALILNDDIYLGHTTNDILKLISEMRSGFMQSHVSWSAFIISKDLYTHIGEFDEQFYPAYYEDSDYIYRMKLEGIKHDVREELNPQQYIISGTYEKDHELVNNAMQVNRERYAAKWGGSPLLETFYCPYNNQK